MIDHTPHRGRCAALAGTLLTALVAAAPAAAQRFDWDAIGAEFCRHAVAGDLAAMRPILSPSLARLIEAAHGRGAIPPRLLFQSFDAAAPTCQPSTRNVAVVEVRRAVSGGSPAWTDYLVMAPERDGSTRIDDILFSTRRSDTLRARLAIILGAN